MHMYLFLMALDPTSEIRHANLGDWQEEVYQKVMLIFFSTLYADEFLNVVSYFFIYTLCGLIMSLLL